MIEADSSDPAMTRKPGGRPTKLTSEVQEKIVQALAAGNYLETAAAYAGVHRFTLHRWLKLGANAKSGRHRQFCDAVQTAMAQAEIRDVAIIGQAAGKQWQAAAWRLERKFPQRWGRKTYHDIQTIPTRAIIDALEQRKDFDSLRRIADGENPMAILLEWFGRGEDLELTIPRSSREIEID